MSASNTTIGAVTEQIAEGLDDIKPKLRGWMHAAAAPLAFFSFLAMMVLADDVRTRIGVAVFMVSATLMFTTSAIYHTGTWTPRTSLVLRRLDHANIFILIAGSSTPFAILLLTDAHMTILMSVMWGGALLGVIFKVFWLNSPRWLHVPIYLLLGWAPIAFANDFIGSAPPGALILLATGGAIYSIGALVYATQWPNPSRTYFGFHEVFHSLTVIAFFTHYIGVSLLIYGHR